MKLEERDRENPSTEHGSPAPGGADQMVAEPGIRRFNHIVLPVIFIVIGIVTWLMVTNAFQANELMEQNGRATPTILDPGVH